MEQLGEISGILFFLLGAMTIVELIDAHDGFQIITDRIKTKNTVKLLWIIGIITFFLSAILDNLTTTIVIVSMLRKIILDREQRLFFAGITVIAANAGGAWSPLGDVTTTMLWIGGQITAVNIILQLFTTTIANETIIVMAIGLLSAIVDNVPLVAAAQGMYSLEQYPTDHFFWEFLAYATGTGGSALIIGSAAGVAAMGMEKIEFFWYVKKITWLALIGYFVGAIIYIVQYSLSH